MTKLYYLIAVTVKALVRFYNTLYYSIVSKTEKEKLIININANLSSMSLPILIVCGYVVIAVIIYLITSFIDGRKIGKGEITREKADDEIEDNAMIAILWPIAALFLISISSFALLHFIGEGMRKIGENTIKFSSNHDADSVCDNLSDSRTSN